MSLPQKLLEYRRAEKLSQEDLAAQLGVSRQSVSKWEQGLSFPETEKLIDLSNRMGISIDCLLKGESARPEPPEPKEPEVPSPAQEQPAPAGKSRLTAVLAVLLAITGLALVFVLCFWRQPADPEKPVPHTSEPTGESASPTDSTEPEETEPEQTEPVTEPPAEPEGLQNMDLMELREWFYRFGRDYRLDYMPQFTAQEGPPTDSGEYLYWASAVKMNYSDEDKGKMSRSYVEVTVERHFGVTPVDHRSHHKQWTYDGETEMYTAWPEGMREKPCYLLRSIEIDGDTFTVHAAGYRANTYIASSEEDDLMVYEALMSGNTGDLILESEVILTFRLNTPSITNLGTDPNDPIFLAHVVTEYK